MTKCTTPLACQPGERRHREHHELVQLAECDGHDQKRKSADRHGQRHALQHAASHHPPAHRHVVQRKGERAKSSVKDPEQGLPPRSLIVFLVCLQCLRHTVIPSCPSVPADRSERLLWVGCRNSSYDTNFCPKIAQI